MNASYVYGIFQCCEENKLPDLYIAHAQYQVDHKLPGGLTEKQVNEFIGHHYNDLVKAYAPHDPVVFEEAVKACVAADIEKENKK